MNRKISFLIAFALILSVIFSFTTNTDKDSRYKEYPIISITGDEPRNPNSKIFTGDIDAVNKKKPYTMTYSDSLVEITDVYTGVHSIYDLQSNGVTQHLMQWYKDTLHAVFMWNMTPGIPAADRRVLYLVSTNTGASWDNLGEVPSGISAGFPAIYLFDDGRAVIGEHAAVNNAPSHAILQHDILPLGGTFQLCDPGSVPGADQRVWVRHVTTATNKVPFLCAYNVTQDTVTKGNVLTNPSNCTFSGWQNQDDIDNAEQYAFARAANGTIGLAYIRCGNVTTANAGDVRYITSTDDGLTWSTPTVVYDCTPNPNDFMGALRGIDLIFRGNEPCISFDLVHQTDAGSYYPGLCTRVMFWSPTVNSGNPVVIADSTKVPCNGVQGINDVYTSICRGTIGKSRDEVILFSAFSVARSDVWPTDSTPYMDVYTAWSNDHGATWNGYNRVTNLSGPVRDCRYPSIAPVNDQDPNFYYANIEYQNDSVPGSAVNGAPESPAEQHFLRLKYLGVIGVKNIGSEVPKNYVLHQNYPNPFNPSTTIRFELPTTEIVTMRVFDVTGREIAVLINNEKVAAGLKEVDFNGIELPSGVYFYELRAGNFVQTKKMVLIK